MQLKFFRALYQVCLFSFPLVFFSLTAKLLHAKEFEAGKNGVDTTLSKQNPTALVDKQGNSGEEQEAEKTILPLPLAECISILQNYQVMRASCSPTPTSEQDVSLTRTLREHTTNLQKPDAPPSTLNTARLVEFNTGDPPQSPLKRGTYIPPFLTGALVRRARGDRSYPSSIASTGLKRPNPIASELEEQFPSTLSLQANRPITKFKNSPPLIPPYKGGKLEILPPPLIKGTGPLVRIGEGSFQDCCKRSNNGETQQITSTVRPSPNQEEELGVKPENDTAEPTTPISVAQVPREEQPPSLESLPELQPAPIQPPPDELLPPPAQELPPPESTSEEAPATLIVEQFKFEGNTVFSDAKLAEMLQGYIGRRISFAELLQARTAITKLYTDNGYATSGAIIPQQKISNPDSAVVTIKVVEGTLERINITGTRRLRPDYITSRLALAQTKPLNVNSLLEKLQLLQLDPVIQNLSADLQAGTRPGTNILQVEVKEADTFHTDLRIDNMRSPVVGSVRRRIVVNEANLLGFGDALSLGYTNTEGSNSGDFSYAFPVSPNDSKVILGFGIAESNVIEEPFDRLNISSKYRYYELTYRHPVIRKPTQELALGVTFSHQRSQTFLGIDEIGPFPLAPGADEQGRTRVSALRFFQEWTKRSSQDVLALRSQFSLGLNVLGATINNDGEPDSRFFAWRGQGQWARLLARDTLLLLKTDMQLSNSRLLGLEQFAIGGQESVRGYRQDYLLKDNGFLASAEVRLPILRVPKVQGLLQLAPFIDVGTAWNNGDEPSDSEIPNTLISTGLGVLWRMGDDFTARVDFGIPLVSIDKRGDTWQEKGIYFSINYSLF